MLNLWSFLETAEDSTCRFQIFIYFYRFLHISTHFYIFLHISIHFYTFPHISLDFDVFLYISLHSRGPCTTPLAQPECGLLLRPNLFLNWSSTRLREHSGQAAPNAKLCLKNADSTTLWAPTNQFSCTKCKTVS